MPERLQRKRARGWCAPEGAKYVGRGSKFGNPNRIVANEGGWSVIHDNGGAVGIFGDQTDAHRFAVQAYQHHLADARAAYDHAVDLHGEEAVEVLMRQVARSPWTPGKLPPPVHRDGAPLIPAPAAPPCGEILNGKLIEGAGSIDTWQERTDA